VSPNTELPPHIEISWLQAAQHGDQDAYGRLVRHYQALVIHVAYGVCDDVETANDIAQDTFIKAWQHLNRFQPTQSGSFRAWLCRIARNRAIDVIRCQRPQAELSPSLPYHAPTPEEVMLRHETIVSIEQAIRELPEAMRSALILRELEGLSYREIAVVLDIPQGTVMSRIYHARKRLAAALTHSTKAAPVP